MDNQGSVVVQSNEIENLILQKMGEINAHLKLLEKYFNFENLSKIETLERLTELKKLENLDKLKSLESLSSLDKLDNLKQLTVLQSLGEIGKLRQDIEVSFDKLSNLKDLHKLDNLSSLSRLDSLQELVHLNELKSLGQLDLLNKLDNLKSLEQLSHLNQLGELGSLKNLESLRELNKLEVFDDTLKREGHKLDKLTHLDKLDSLVKLDQLSQLVKLDHLKFLDQLNDLSKLDRLNLLEQLNSLKELSKLKDLTNLEKLSKLEKLDNLEQLENLSSLDKIEEVKRIVGEPAWKLLEKLEKLDILVNHRKTVYLGLFLSSFFDLIKIVIVAGIIIFFVATKINNDQLNKLYQYFSISDSAGINFTLPILEKTSTKQEIGSLYNTVLEKGKSEARQFFSTASAFNIESKLNSIHFVHDLNYVDKKFDLKKDTLLFFDDLMGKIENKFNFETEDLSNKYKDDQEKLAFVKQMNYMYFNKRCADLLKLASTSNQITSLEAYTRMAMSLATYCLFKENDFNREKTIATLPTELFNVSI